MHKQRWIIILMVTVLSIPSALLVSQTKLSAQSIMKFLNIGVGARAVGMGDSFITNGNDVSVAFWNPAGIGHLEGTNMMIDMNRWISDVQQYSLALSQDLGTYGVLGVSFTMMDYGIIHGTTIDIVSAGSGAFEYLETGQINVTNMAVGLLYARAISNQFSIGGQVRYVYSGLGTNIVQSAMGQENLDNNLAALSFDVGTWFNTEFNDLTFGMSLRNFSREVRYPRMSQGYYLPLIFTIGFSIDAAHLVMAEKSNHSLIISVNGLHPMDYAEKMNVGVEYGFQNQWFLRGGYKFNYSIESYTAGLGIRYPVSVDEYLQFDYSYSAMVYFDGVHRLTVSSHF